ncbi:MAG: hypothetical protein WCD86_25290 [Ktedonobacteraceae bacterium]
MTEMHAYGYSLKDTTRYAAGGLNFRSASRLVLSTLCDPFCGRKTTNYEFIHTDGRLDVEELTTNFASEPENKRQEAFAQGKAQGLPLVEGEYTIGGGYHYYPPIAQARRWTVDAGFTVMDEAEGDGYYHFLTRKQSM